MTTTQFANLAQMGAAISVIASLVFVAIRLGQNTAMMRINAASERLQREYDIASPMIQNREIAEIWIKADKEFDSLDEIDQERMIVYERRAIALWHHVYILRKRKVFADSEWHEAKWMIRQYGRRQANRAAWRVCKGAFEKPFQVFVEEQISIADHSESQK
jgi:hypothetical protein